MAAKRKKGEAEGRAAHPDNLNLDESARAPTLDEVEQEQAAEDQAPGVESEPGDLTWRVSIDGGKREVLSLDLPTPCGRGGHPYLLVRLQDGADPIVIPAKGTTVNGVPVWDDERNDWTQDWPEKAV